MNATLRQALGLGPEKTAEPSLTGALYATDSGGETGQTCVFLDAELSIKRHPRMEFFAQLSVDGRGDDSEARTTFPVSESMNLAHPDDRRISWTDGRTDQRYFFDFEDTVPEELVQAIRNKLLAAIFESKYKKSASDASEEDLTALLWTPEKDGPKGNGTVSDLILTSGEVCRIEHVKLARFDMKQEVFVPLRENATLTVNKGPANETTSFSFFVFEASGRKILDQQIENDILPQFDSTASTLTWILMTGDEDAPRLCFQLTFEDPAKFTLFRNQFSVCLYEVNNQVSFDGLKDVDREWVRESAQDDMEIEEFEDEKDEPDEPERLLEEPKSRVNLSPISQTPGKNSHLAVAANNDRTFVVRGEKLGVFRTADDGPVFDTMVLLQSPAGRMFSPAEVMLHDQDTSMLMLHPDDDSKISRMDLERGEVVDEWAGSTPVRSLARTAKYSNLTPAKDFIGTNANSLMRFDPRSPAIMAQSKDYAKSTRARLECATTTGAGHIAVASENGDIRLFDSIGKNAKTHLPGLGEKIIAIDVSEDGFFVLATTSQYLLLVDTRVKGQEKGGFLKSMGAAKPPPRKLAIAPSDVVKYRMGHISFTPAHFNTGTSMERSIVASTGNFIVVWNFRQVKQGRTDAYQIKRYKDHVVADDFKYDNDGKVIVTLPNDVTMNSLRAR